MTKQCVDCEHYTPSDYDNPEVSGCCEYDGETVKGKQQACQGFTHL